MLSNKNRRISLKIDRKQSIATDNAGRVLRSRKRRVTSKAQDVDLNFLALQVASLRSAMGMDAMYGFVTEKNWCTGKLMKARSKMKIKSKYQRTPDPDSRSDQSDEGWWLNRCVLCPC